MKMRPLKPAGELPLRFWFCLVWVGLIIVAWGGYAPPLQAATCSVPSTAYSTIQAAINDPTCVTINLAAGTYSEQLRVNRSLTIQGAGRLATILDGGGSGRPLTIGGSETRLYIYNLRITNGVASSDPPAGGGVLVMRGATLHAANLQIDHNIASTGTETGMGGGLAVINGTAYLTGTLVMSNTAMFAGTGGGWGGGLYVAGDQDAGRAILHMTDSAVRDNVAYNADVGVGTDPRPAGGGGLYVGASAYTSIHLSNNIWKGNVARLAGSSPGPGDGGAIAIRMPSATATLSIQGDQFVGNSANAARNTTIGDSARGGALYLDALPDGQIIATLTDVGLHSNSASASPSGQTVGQGGAIYARNSQVTFVGGDLTYNIAGIGTGADARAQGGAIALSRATLVGDRLRILDNIALQGAGSAETALDSQGGGIALGSSAVLTLTNSIIADNRVAYISGNGAGLYVGDNARASLTHVTLAAATYNDHAGIFASATGAVGDIQLSNTMVVSHAIGIHNQGVAGRVVQQYVLVDGNGTDVAGSVMGDTMMIRAAPRFIDPLNRDYRLRSDSAAINAGRDVGVTTDIDGDRRPQHGGFDIGADEHSAPIGVMTARIEGAMSGPPGEYAFVGRIDPWFASPPITFQWDNGATTAASKRILTAPGVYTMTLAATNSQGSATTSRTLTIRPPAPATECAVPLSAVTIAAATTGATYTFTANTAPGDATHPLSYTWSPEPMLGQGTANATYMWSTDGPQTIAVTVQNCGRSVAATHVVDVVIIRLPTPISTLTPLSNPLPMSTPAPVLERRIYLPLVVR